MAPPAGRTIPSSFVNGDTRAGEDWVGGPFVVGPAGRAGRGAPSRSARGTYTPRPQPAHAPRRTPHVAAVPARHTIAFCPGRPPAGRPARASPWRGPTHAPRHA